MLINNISIDRNLQNASVLQFQIEFKQAKIVSSQRVDVSNNVSATKEPKTKDRATSTQNKGKVQAKRDTATTSTTSTTSGTTPTEKASSIVFKIKKAIIGN